MEAQYIPTSATQPVTRYQCDGDFIKIETVPSGNTLSIKTSENETFIGGQGRSVKFEKIFSWIQIAGNLAGEELVFQTGRGWMMDSVFAPVTVNIPQPLTVRGEQMVGSPYNGTESPFLGGYVQNGDIHPFTSQEDTGVGVNIPDTFQTGVIGVGVGDFFPGNFFNRKTMTLQVRNLQAGDTLKVLQSTNSGAGFGFYKQAVITNLSTGAAVAGGTITADGIYTFANQGIRTIQVTSNAGALTAPVTVSLNGSTA